MPCVASRVKLLFRQTRRPQLVHLGIKRTATCYPVIWTYRRQELRHRLMIAEGRDAKMKVAVTPLGTRIVDTSDPAARRIHLAIGQMILALRCTTQITIAFSLWVLGRGSDHHPHMPIPIPSRPRHNWFDAAAKEFTESSPMATSVGAMMSVAWTTSGCAE